MSIHLMTTRRRIRRLSNDLGVTTLLFDMLLTVSVTTIVANVMTS